MPKKIDKLKDNTSEEEKKNIKKSPKEKAPKKEKEKAPKKDFQLYKKIREEKIYKSNIKARDSSARRYIVENCAVMPPKSILPGQLISFNYFEPKTKEELEYYDAMPVTIFFGIVNSKNGRRVLGFNLHYYPPRMRYKILDRIFEIFKPIYLKSWNDPLKKELSHIDYKMLLEQLTAAKLDFGVRMYIPNLIAEIRPVPPKGWSKAVFTEGRFKKRTREAIMNYWKNKK